MSDAGFAGNAPVRDAHRFDEARLAGWMAQHVAGYDGPLRVEQFKGGRSNPTYRLVTPTRAYVLRRKPPGDLLKGAPAIEREARVMRDVAPHGVPVPHVHALCEDEGVIGTASYVMGMVEGRIFWDPALPGLTRDERGAVFDAMNATIATLYGLDPVAVGLGDFGRPSNFFERQIARSTRQYREDATAGRDPTLDRLAEWLPAHVLPSGRRDADCPW